MKAYIDKVKVLDDDGEHIADIVHDTDDMYFVKLVDKAYIVPRDFRFIGDVLELDLLNGYILEKEG